MLTDKDGRLQWGRQGSSQDSQIQPEPGGLQEVAGVVGDAHLGPAGGLRLGHGGQGPGGERSAQTGAEGGPGWAGREDGDQVYRLSGQSQGGSLTALWSRGNYQTIAWIVHLTSFILHLTSLHAFNVNLPLSVRLF